MRSLSNKRVVVIAALVALAMTLTACFGTPQPSGPRAMFKADVTVEPRAMYNSDADLAQCRFDAILSYMYSQGFVDGEFAIGEDSVDYTLPEATEQGAGAFSTAITSLADLQTRFESSDPKQVAATEVIVAQYPSLSRQLVVNIANWEVVQILVNTTVHGNTAYSADGFVVSAGNRASNSGDISAILIDPKACTVRTPEVVPATADPEDPDPVTLVRFGCNNPGSGLTPLEPKDPSQGSGAQGNAPDGSGTNHDPGSGTLTPPLEQPPTGPYGPPTTPPAQELPQDPEPLPVPTPEPSAPPPGAPETECVVIPNVEDCAPV